VSQVVQRRPRRSRPIARATPDGIQPASTASVSVNDVVRSIFHDGVLTPRETGSIYVANEAPLGILHTGRDWEKGAALHADARPDPSSGVAYHGAPWDWTISGQLVDTYQWHNVWHECTPYGSAPGVPPTGLPAGVRVQYRNVESWNLDAALTAWTKTLGVGAASGYQQSSGNPQGGYFRSTPDYSKEADIGGWSSPGTTANGYTYPASPGSKWRVESSAHGGGWSISLDPMRDSSGNVIDDLAVCHGPFSNSISPDRILVPTGGYFCHSGEARLIMDDYSAVPASAKFTATLGVDIFTAQTAAQDPSTARNTSACNPRHRILPTDGSWVWLGHCAGSAAQIRSFPTLPFVNA